jgi:hypothetical protein
VFDFNASNNFDSQAGTRKSAGNFGTTGTPKLMVQGRAGLTSPAVQVSDSFTFSRWPV